VEVNIKSMAAAIEFKRCVLTMADKVAELLFEGFADVPSAAWPDAASARREVVQSLEGGRISIVAAERGDIAGWIGGIPRYGVTTWELHPLIVKREARGRGIGTALVGELERAVRAAGGMNIYLGTDDEHGRTNISGRELYPGVLEKLAELRDTGGHPFAFYRKVGYEVVGIIPHANGFGKPDIIMARKL